MAEEIPAVPKAGSFYIHTGNIVNWNRLKRKLTQSPSEEVRTAKRHDARNERMRFYVDPNCHVHLNHCEYVRVLYSCSFKCKFSFAKHKEKCNIW